MSPLPTNGEGLRERRNDCSPSLNGKGPSGAYDDASAILKRSERKQNPENGQPQDNRGISREDQTSTSQSTTRDNGSRILRFQEAVTTTNSRPITQTETK